MHSHRYLILAFKGKKKIVDALALIMTLLLNELSTQEKGRAHCLYVQGKTIMKLLLYYIIIL